MNRFYLKKSSVISLKAEDEDNIRTFTVEKKIKAGSSAVTYYAHYSGSGTGVLKEFYPKDAYAQLGLLRDSENQLVYDSALEDGAEQFRAAAERYISTYKTLLRAKRSGRKNDVLSTFIPHFEIFRSLDPDYGSVYIWTTDPNLVTFDKICQEIHSDPEDKPEHKLVQILCAIESLNECICELHKLGMLHRDIKPANFGFEKRGEKTLTQSLTMFDIDTVCSVFDPPADKAGTPGFTEKEQRLNPPTNQTDIYGIGATLFSALVVSNESRQKSLVYKDEYFPHLKEMVDSSELIQASEANSHPTLRNILTEILKKSLCSRDKRYSCCEELAEDIKRAKYYALPSEIAKDMSPSERWILADVDKFLDKNTERSTTLALQYQLYTEPLYKHTDNTGNAVNIYVFGFGKYGRRFTDLAAQTGQMPEIKLNITAVSNRESDAAEYLSDRPELEKFFNFNGSITNDPECYGNISTRVMELDPDDSSQQRLMKSFSRKKPGYIFIALGSDKLNEKFASVLSRLNTGSYICYVRESRVEKKAAAGTDIIKVYDDLSRYKFSSEIERMAFNTHMLWKSDLSIDYKKVRAEFRVPYNHDSSVSSILSIKYKLYSMGIDLEQLSNEEAARQFLEVMRKNSKMTDLLICYEHRRWTAEKICEGYTRITDLSECRAGKSSTRDKKNKRHICIVRSRPERPLETSFSREKWDSCTKEELQKLDELDRMSVELHRMYRRYAEEARRQNIITGESINGVRTLISSDPSASAAFQEWYSCIKDIWNGDSEKSRLYTGLKDAFEASLKGYTNEEKNSVKGLVQSFDSQFYPIYASMEYTNYKNNDAQLIKNIPFILTNSSSIYLAVPFVEGDNNSMFANVASATVIDPAKVIYLSYINSNEELKALKKTLVYISGYMLKKKLRASVEFIIGSKNTGSAVFEDIENQLRELSGGRVKAVKLVEDKNSRAFAGSLDDIFSGSRFSGHYFAVENNDTALSGVMYGYGLHEKYRGYEFDSAELKFTSLCDEICIFSYVTRKPKMSVSDMAAFKQSGSAGADQPEFYNEYRELWKVYQKDPWAWKQFCTVIGKAAAQSDSLASFSFVSQSQKNEKTAVYRYLLPFQCSRAARKITSQLLESKVIEGGSEVNGYTSDSCEVMIRDRTGNKRSFDRVFTNIIALMSPESITAYFDPHRKEVKVEYDDLYIRNADISRLTNDEYVKVMKLAEYFESIGFIMGLREVDKKLSLIFATHQIKHLLTVQGRMLEVYTYHKVKETGGFDDAASSFEVNWEGTTVKSEFDCILTKGFRTLFVECKARPEIESGFYEKLTSQVKQFGINAKAVLVIDTQEKEWYFTAKLNDTRRQQGDMLDIITVWKPDEIENIGETLLSIINGTYQKDIRS